MDTYFLARAEEKQNSKIKFKNENRYIPQTPQNPKHWRLCISLLFII